MKNHFPQKYCLNSAFEAFLAKSDTMKSSMEKTYKIGIMEKENPIAMNTGGLSSGNEMSLIAESGSKKTSSSSLVDLMPIDCNWTSERWAEWLKVKLKSMTSQIR
jgi:hypothetical protein